MGQSYLFPGQDTEHLSPYQRQLEKLYDQVDRPGHRIPSSQFFTSPEYLQFITSQYGEMPVPPGHQVVEQSPTKLVTKDAKGYTHTYTRDVAGGREGGQIKEMTDAPPIEGQSGAGEQDIAKALAPSYQQLLEQQIANQTALARGERPAAYDPGISGYMSQAEQIAQRLAGPQTLAALDPEAKAAFEAISAAEQARLKQQQDQAQGDLLARLYGSGVQRSSIAGENLAQMLQQFGLVNQQQQSDAAARELAAREYLTNFGLQSSQAAAQQFLGLAGAGLEGFRATQSAAQGQQGMSQDFLTNLLNQALQRETGAAGLTLDYKKLEETIRQANMQNTLGQLQVQTEQEKLDAQNSTFNKIMAGIGAAASIAGAPFTGGASLSGLTGTFSNLFKGRSSGAITGAGSQWPQN